MGSIKKIIFFSHMLFCKRDYERFGIKTLQDNGFEVEYWDFAPFLYPRAFQEVRVPDPFQFYGCRYFSNLNELKEAISGLDKTSFIISFISYGLDSYGIFKAISQKKLKFCVCVVGSSYPGVSIGPIETERRFKPAMILSNTLNKLLKLNMRRVFRCHLFPRIPFRFLGVRSADLILDGAVVDQKAYSGFYPVDKNSELLNIHCFDYDSFLVESKKPFQVDNKVGVFLDEYLPFHPDKFYEDNPIAIKPVDYYASLCRFFNYLEKNSGVKIIIAAHPRSHYEKHQDYFEGRKVIRGQTIKLVRESGFVLATQSTSINYAVLFQKPILIISTDAINQTIYFNCISCIANTLGKQIININRPFMIDWEKERMVDKDKYANFKQLYIKNSGTEELPFWQVVANRISKY